jgi:hypothetical protein
MYSWKFIDGYARDGEILQSIFEMRKETENGGLSRSAQGSQGERWETNGAAASGALALQ